MSTDTPSPSAARPRRLFEQLFHDTFSPGETQRIRAYVRGVVDERLRALADPIAQGDEVHDGFPTEAFVAMAEAGLFRIPFAPPHGDGLDHPATATAVTVE